jgi:transposase
MIRKHFCGIVSWAQTRQTDSFPEAIDGLLQAVKRRVLRDANFETMRTVVFLIARKRDLAAIKQLWLA